MNPAPGPLISLTGRYVESGFCGEVSAPYIYDHELETNIGVYIDDTTPNIAHWVELALALFPFPKRVFVGIPPNKDIAIPTEPIQNLVRLQEWLPWGEASGPGQSTYPWREFGPVPKCGVGNGYILQRHWPGEFGKNPPSKDCWQTCLTQAKAHKPRYIFVI